MAREIAATATEVWRAVVVWKVRGTGDIVTVHHGVYERRSTGAGYVTALRNARWRIAPGGRTWETRQREAVIWDFVDGWTERGEIAWDARGAKDEECTKCGVRQDYLGLCDECAAGEGDDHVGR